MSTEIVGTHPYADKMGPLVDAEIEELAESISEVGQLNPVVITQDGRLVDGRNRQAACERLGIAPEVQVREFGSDDEIADFIVAANNKRRHRSTGQRAMATAIVLHANGRRQGGRWKRGSVDNGSSSDIEPAWLKAVQQCGLILDIADRADGLDGFDEFVSAPTDVRDGDISLDFAHKQATKFEDRAALAEMAAFAPLTTALSHLADAVSDIEKYGRLPQVPMSLKKEHRAEIKDLAERMKTVAAATVAYEKESKWMSVFVSDRVRRAMQAVALKLSRGEIANVDQEVLESFGGDIEMYVESATRSQVDVDSRKLKRDFRDAMRKDIEGGTVGSTQLAIPGDDWTYEEILESFQKTAVLGALAKPPKGSAR